MIQVLGHLHPDSDAVCTAVVAAQWLTHSGRDARAWRTGELNKETQFIFQRANLTPPALLDMPLQDCDVWLVDFTEPAQGPQSLQESNIVGIIDHHRLGGLVTRLPPEVWIKPVGSSATVLWQLMQPETLCVAHAVLLLGAILSDTVALRSPTTTDDDRRAVDALAAIANIDLATFTHDLLAAKTDITGMSAHALLNKDIKAFTLAGHAVQIAQLELYSRAQVDAVLPELLEEMNAHAVRTGAELVVLMLSEISENGSVLYFSGSALADAEPRHVPGMLSRKKQMLPWLEERLRAQSA
ncbi:inorganic pyrophosphatase [Superficieibacter electus]|uniref:inorganic diphosphatase n=1 Tax=Superficieibacter electus TaxID=2022662 RepID=A0A2P5GMX6_9ENTR|nr:DHHA2 domain-containing protein [Superficieibacter electus]POP44652.1 inorganic pyrophosphatase [Superficieibacter electus]POP47459.1 inorganic pyrophosphatase [Superficieibacter electus]